MADDYQAQLLAVEAKLAKDPDNEELLTLKSDLLEIIELSGSLEEDEEQERQLSKQSQRQQQQQQYQTTSNKQHQTTVTTTNATHKPSSGRKTVTDDELEEQEKSQTSKHQPGQCNLVSSADQGDDESTSRSDINQQQRRQLTEAEMMAKRKEKNRKKKAKLREKFKEQQDTAESVKASWQSFANQRGLKGLNKRSIFASPSSVTGKVGVGTNGIADMAPTKGARLPSTGAAGSSSSASSAPISKRRY